MRAIENLKIGLMIVTCMLLISACSSDPTPQPTLDTSQLRGLLPAVSQDDIQEKAQLADESTLALGKTVYEQSCAECHGIDGEGQFPDDPMQPDETGRIGAPPHNGDGHTWHHDDGLIVDYVINGGRGNPSDFYPMPGFADVLSDDEIEAVVAYIKTFWTEEQRLLQAERTLQMENQ